MDTKTQRNIKRVKNTDIDRETAERKAAATAAETL